MNGAQSLVRTLVGCGVDVCFMNPGTSEMHFVATLDAVPEMRGVLALFEGVVTGAADGYGRMAEKPAATLLHLGPGLGNGLANLHNARRAGTPIVNIVGDHATYHKKFDAPLESAIEGVARNVSPAFVRWGTTPETLGADTVEAYRAAVGPPGQVATLVVPADVSWGDGGAVAPPPPRRTAGSVDSERVDVGGLGAAIGPAGDDLPRRRRPAGRRGDGGQPGRGGHRVHGCRPRPSRPGCPGARGCPRSSGWPTSASRPPRSWRGRSTWSWSTPSRRSASSPTRAGRVGSSPEDCEIHVLAGPGEDVAARRWRRWPRSSGPARGRPRPRSPGRGCRAGASTCGPWPRQSGALLPEDAIVSDEANTSGLFSAAMTTGLPAP